MSLGIEWSNRRKRFKWREWIDRLFSVPIRLTHTHTHPLHLVACAAFLNRTLDTERESENVPGRIHVAVVACATGGTFPRSYSKPCDTFRPLRWQRTALRTGLGCELLTDIQIHSPVPAGFVSELRPEHRPASIEHGFCHPRLCKRGRVDVTDRDQRIVARDLGRRLVDKIVAAILDLGVDSLDAALVTGALRNRQPLFMSTINARRLDGHTIAACGHGL